jgi:hypothetical protein
MAKPARSLNDLPELPGWLTFGEAAALMEISVERVRQLASEPNAKLTTARRIGRRPLGIVREAEVLEWKRRKSTRLAEAADAELLKADAEKAAAGEAELRSLPGDRPVYHQDGPQHYRS